MPDRTVKVEVDIARIPVTITQKGTGFKLAAKSVGGTYASALNADKTELNGTWTQGQNALPLTLKRATPPLGH